ncbi:hypothetical protein ACFL1A_01685 [Patescibacteria group bacterium]
MKSYQQFRNDSLPWYRQVAGLPIDHGTEQEIIQILIEKHKWPDAVELIFARGRKTEHDKVLRLSFVIFMVLWSRVHNDVIEEIASNHHWADEEDQDALSIQVYPGEFLVIPEPSATIAKTKLELLHIIQ